MSHISRQAQYQTGRQTNNQAERQTVTQAEGLQTNSAAVHLPVPRVALEQAQIISQDSHPLKAVDILKSPKELLCICPALAKPVRTKPRASRLLTHCCSASSSRASMPDCQSFCMKYFGVCGRESLLCHICYSQAAPNTCPQALPCVALSLVYRPGTHRGY